MLKTMYRKIIYFYHKSFKSHTPSSRPSLYKNSPQNHLSKLIPLPSPIDLSFLPFF